MPFYYIERKSYHFQASSAYNLTLRQINFQQYYEELKTSQLLEPWLFYMLFLESSN